MRCGLFSRRRFLAAAILSAPLLAAGDAKWLEPEWVKVRRFRIGDGKPLRRLVHFTDVHHKGDRAYLRRIVRTINSLSPDFACFTGDLIEEGKFLPEALELLAGIKSPLYGVPGNHDYWSKAPFGDIARCFEATGGGWLLNQQIVTGDGRFCLSGAIARSFREPGIQAHPTVRNILLMHYPAWAKQLSGRSYDLILAGHSHGGQVRIPFYGAVWLPFGVDEFDLGWFRTGAGPLYVNPGLGWYPVPLRFNCRPEITVIEL